MDSSWHSFPRKGSCPVDFCLSAHVGGLLTTVTAQYHAQRQQALTRRGSCVLTCPPHPQVRGHLQGGEGAEPAGVSAQRAHLLPGMPGHPARGVAAGLVQ